ncbi:hypothetical protein GTP41_22235 [Pseudoduganella sp. DS3]|uniref:Virulence factor n=2 Tax=Pseudoduganella guangdongensis TaxID=2692179 RepID=A0A6N9HMD4_9BURK|nr:hypothetical protein [Pseudoduganella guangdongensis]
MTRLLGIPALVALSCLALTTGCSQLANRTSVASGTAEVAVASSQPFRVQVVGVQWLNPLVRRDYPTEWQLLWTLGLVKPNRNDEKVKEKPAKFSTVQPIAAIAVNLGKNTPAGFLDAYLSDTFKPLSRGYATEAKYFYTVQPEKVQYWRELHGIHVEVAVPDIPQLGADRVTAMVVDQLDAQFVFRSVPNLSTANIPADVNTTVGGANVGFTSLAKAMDYLEKHPNKSVWVYSWDSPDFPKDEQMSENSTLLVLAGPTFNTEREPLAWISRPSVQEAKTFEARDGQSRVAQAWQTAIRKASEQAKIEPTKISYVIHDAGYGNDVSGERLGMLGQALATTAPELDFMKQTFNTSKLLGDMRAGSALTNIALAIAWTHQKGQPVLVAGTTEPERATVVVVTPPAKPRLYNPDKDWFRARGEGTTYLPWWGMRKDEKWDSYMQGYSF